MENEKNAIEEINRLWKMAQTGETIGVTSAIAIEARARWNAARKMYELLTGKEWHAM